MKLNIPIALFLLRTFEVVEVREYFTFWMYWVDPCVARAIVYKLIVAIFVGSQTSNWMTLRSSLLRFRACING